MWVLNVYYTELFSVLQPCCIHKSNNIKTKIKNVFKSKNMTKIESLFIERGSRAILNICNVLK